LLWVLSFIPRYHRDRKLKSSTVPKRTNDEKVDLDIHPNACSFTRPATLLFACVEKEDFGEGSKHYNHWQLWHPISLRLSRPRKHLRMYEAVPQQGPYNLTNRMTLQKPMGRAEYGHRKQRQSSKDQAK
jgi:hypothetical protein